MKIVVKICQKCKKAYGTLPYKCPRCGCYDYDITEIEINFEEVKMTPKSICACCLQEYVGWSREPFCQKCGGKMVTLKEVKNDGKMDGLDKRTGKN